jgi:DNA-binding NtrC family response regulator
MAAILIVDDDEPMLEALTEAIQDLGHEPCPARSGETALEILDREPVAAILLDLRMPGMGGLEVLRRIRMRPRPTAVTVLTAYASADNTIEAMRLGAFDHLTKPIGRADLARAIEHMLAASTVPRPGPTAAEEGTFIGSSEAMRNVQKTIGLVADSEATVLITGETGTGKEIVARAIHDHGRRGGRPFIALNCTAIPRDLLESMLFGHVRGAFTGATSDRAGAFREAEGGTLFLDEIGDMDIAMQAKILRALQERMVTPVGGRPLAVDVRVIAATHRDLVRRVRDGRFREDLYYRLHVVPIHLPPLRERIADIVPLAEHFLEGSGRRLSADAAMRLIRYPWPGNVRELQNAMQRAALLTRGFSIDGPVLDFLGETSVPAPPGIDWPDEDLPTAITRLEAFLIRRALERCGGNRAEAARLLGIHRQLLYVKMGRYGIDPSGIRSEGVGEPDSGT